MFMRTMFICSNICTTSHNPNTAQQDCRLGAFLITELLNMHIALYHAPTFIYAIHTLKSFLFITSPLFIIISYFVYSLLLLFL
eukprot:gene786-428_t